MRKLILIACLFTFTFPALKAQISNEQVYKFNRVMDLISMFYVDTIQENMLIEKAIVSVLKDLDPHSIYVGKDEVRELNEPLIGSFDGIGITYQMLRDTVYIVSAFPGGPSDRMGIRAGDRIIAIDNKPVSGLGLDTEEIKKYLTGNQGSSVSLQVKQDGQMDLMSYSIPREQIPIYSIDAAYQVDETTGYIRLNKFSANSLEEFTNSAKKLKKAGVENLILDLRDNGGGYLKAAIDITDQFLNDKKLIVYTLGMSSPKSEYYSSNKGIFENGKLVILINEGTASASEIVCGAIQDWDRGVLIGRRSFGKGLVQRPFTLMDGSMIRLTIARYYTPTGRLIQKPYVEGFDKYSSDLRDRLKHGEYYTADSIHFADSLKFFTLTNKRKVYGGGGIMPDIFVPLDTSLYPKYYKKILKNGKLSEFVVDYIDKSRVQLNQSYSKFIDFKKNFVVDQYLIRKLMKFAMQGNHGNKWNDEELLADNENNSPEISKKYADYDLDNIYVKNHLKALIAQDLFGIAEYYEIINSTDRTFLKALEILNNKEKYHKLLSSN